MDQDQLIDEEDFFQTESVPIHNAVRWWERKRLIYNLLLFLTEISIILYLWEGFVEFGVELGLLATFLYQIAANFFYCMGWGLEVLTLYYSKTTLTTGTRWLFFIIGVSFSIALTILLIGNALSYQLGFILFNFF